MTWFAKQLHFSEIFLFFLFSSISVIYEQVPLKGLKAQYIKTNTVNKNHLHLSYISTNGHKFPISKRLSKTF